MNARNLNTDLSKWLLATVPDDDGGETRTLLNRVQEHDWALSMELEDAINARVNSAINAAFSLGWECSREPERIVFGEAS